MERMLSSNIIHYRCCFFVCLLQTLALKISVGVMYDDTVLQQRFIRTRLHHLSCIAHHRYSLKYFLFSKALSYSKILGGSERLPLPPWRLNDVFLLRCKLFFCKISTVTRYDLNVPFYNFLKSQNEFVQTLGSNSTRNRIKRFPWFP